MIKLHFYLVEAKGDEPSVHDHDRTFESTESAKAYADSLKDYDIDSTIYSVVANVRDDISDYIMDFDANDFSTYIYLGTDCYESQERVPKMSEALIKAQRKYDKETARRFLLKFNKNTDADVIAKLESVDSIQGYIRELIRKDLSCRE